MASSLIWEEKDGLVYTEKCYCFFLVINFSCSLYSRILDVYKEFN